MSSRGWQNVILQGDSLLQVFLLDMITNLSLHCLNKMY